MRDAEETWHFSIRQTASHRRSRTENTAIGSDSFSTDELENTAGTDVTCSIGSNFFCNAAQSFGKEWERVCVRTKTKPMKPDSENQIKGSVARPADFKRSKRTPRRRKPVRSARR